MTYNEIIKAFDILDKFEFFGGQRAGRELWFDKPTNIQNEDIGAFLRDLDFLKQFINRQNAEIERLEKEGEEVRYKLECLLCHATGGRLSKSTYPLQTMEASVTDFMQEIDEEVVEEAKSNAVKEFAERVGNYIKTKCNPYGKPTFDYETSIAIMNYIDNLVKEFTERKETRFGLQQD